VSSLPLTPLDTLPVTKRRVLLRLDLNITTNTIDAIAADYRVQTSLPVLRDLIKREAKIIILCHRGRPEGRDPELSNAVLAKGLQLALGQVVAFVSDITGEAAQKAVDALQPGQILMLENLRFDAGEEANDAAFAAALAHLGDAYVNDAFASCHRAHASIEAIVGLLPHAAGPRLLYEVATLKQTLGTMARPTAAIVGGAKVSTKIALLENLIAKVDVLFVGGAMANTFLAAEGIDVQKSLYEPSFVPLASQILDKAHSYNCQIMLPHDAQVAATPTGSSFIAPVMNIPPGMSIFDIGPATIMRLSALLRDCRTVIWNGPVGLFEQPAFAAGTNAIAKILTERTRAGYMFSIAGGGDTVAALEAAGYAKGMSYLSTAGGAFLEFLEGKTLPGLAALDL
jgi:phosphoglycerate kinase